MGSKAGPYFILTAEKLPNPKEVCYKGLNTADKTPPITPAPSGAFSSLNEDETLVRQRRQKAKLRYKVPGRESRKRGNLTRKMELIKQKLEKSRERFNLKQRAETDPDLKCEPGLAGSTPDSMESPYKLDRAVSDLGPATKEETATAAAERQDGGALPYVYFVVSDDKPVDSYNGVTLDTGETLKSKSADKRRRVRTVEENRLKLKERKGPAKMLGLAREIGLKSEVDAKQEPRPPTRQPSVNQIVFAGNTHDDASPKRKPNVHVIHSPPRIPPCTPATTQAFSGSDPDETVPRKPFLSGPLYAGKPKIESQHSSPMFGLPDIPADQKRKALGLATRFDEFAYNTKPQSMSSKRKVTFADSLPVIKGSGFVLENRNEMDVDMPPLGPRAVTMGSITLPSERLDKQSMCQKYLFGENLPSARTTRKNGVPLPLPKIDIVSNVYDGMVIKMIQEYLQDSNTPSRQSQLAKDLLVHLQTHSESMRELTVPNLNTLKNRPEFVKQTSLKLQSMLRVPPNTADGSAGRTIGQNRDVQELVINDTEPKETDEELNKQDEDEARLKSAAKKTPENKMAKVPFVQITFKNKDGGDSLPSVDQLPDMAPDDEAPPTTPDGPRDHVTSQGGSRVSKQILMSVTPVSFQMAPPGLSKEDTNLSIQLKA